MLPPNLAPLARTLQHLDPLLAQANPGGGGLSGAFALLDVPDPAPLAGSPVLQRVLFENPLPLTLILVALALVAYVVLNARGRFRQGLFAAGSLVVLAGVVWTLAATIHTDHERVRAAAQDLVRAIAAADARRVGELLADDARAFDIPMSGDFDRDAILDAIPLFLGEGRVYQVREHRVLDTQSALDGPDSARVQIKVRVVPAQWSVPNQSWWALGLRRVETGAGDQWRVISLKPLAISGIQAN
jgi:hypothetical protein